MPVRELGTRMEKENFDFDPERPIERLFSEIASPRLDLNSPS